MPPKSNSLYDKLIKRLSSPLFFQSRSIFWITFTTLALLFIYTHLDLFTGKAVFTHDSIYWFGTYHYFAESIIDMTFPFWDTYMLTGMPYYGVNVSGLLDPLNFLSIALIRFFNFDTVLAHTYFYLFRLFVFSIGAYFLSKELIRCSLSSLLTAFVLLFSIAPPCFRQNGLLHSAYLAPFIFYFTLLLFQNLNRPHRNTYLAGLVLILGIALNIYIPAYLAFYICAFVLCLWIFKIASFNDFLIFLKRPKSYLLLVLTGLILVAFAAPSFFMMSELMSSEGEIFPILRMINHIGSFKKVLATELSTSFISREFSNHMGVHLTLWNFLGLMSPNFWKWIAEYGVGSEVTLYIGGIPFVVALAGLFFFRSRLKLFSTLMILIGALVATTNNLAQNHARFTSLQELFYKIFPPLNMVEGTQLFGAFILLFFCILFGLGMKDVLEGKIWQINSRTAQSDYRFSNFIIILLLTKTIFICVIFRQDLAFSLFDPFNLLALATLAYLSTQQIVSHGQRNALLICLGLVIFTDLWRYNESYRKYVTQPNHLSQLTKNAASNKEKFSYYRRPYPTDNRYQLMGFHELITRTKGGWSFGNSFFSTKRFYDFHSHIPTNNQLKLTSVFSPLFAFYPTSQVIWANKSESLDLLASPRLNTSKLILEIKQKKPPKTTTSTAIKIVDLEDVPWLRRWKILEEFSQLSKNFKQPSIDDLPRTFKLEKFNINSLTATLTTNEDGYFYYNDGWSRYWRAYDNEKEAPILIANYNFKAIFLKAGNHKITFRYDPANYRISLYIHFLALIGSGLYFLFGLRKIRSATP